MNKEKNEMDALFQSGFSREEAYARQIPEEEFRAFMDSGKNRNSGFRAGWKRIILPLAASLLLFGGGGFFWNRLHFSEEISPEIMAMETENLPVSPVISDAVEEKQESKASAQAGTNSKAAKENSMRKKAAAPSKGRSRKKIRPALIAPGILPLPLMVDAGEKKLAEAESDQVVPLKPEEITTAMVPLPEPKTSAAYDPNEILSVEVRPGRDQLRNVAEKQGEQLADFSLPSGNIRTEASFRNIRNVEQAKSYLIRSLGRFVGLIPANEQDIIIETNALNNEL